MSNEALTWAFRQDLPMTQKFVLVALADYADENGTCFPKHETTAQRIGSTVRTVQRALSALEESGHVTMKHQYRDDGRFRSNRYQLRVSDELPRQSVRVTPTESRDDPDTESPLPRQSVATTPTQCRSKNPHLTPMGTPMGTAVADAPAADTGAAGSNERQDVERLCSLLADCIEANGSKRPTISKRWRNEARLLIDRDGRTPEQIAWLIQWSQRDPFWRANVLSMPKLRQQFDTLRLQAQRGATPVMSSREREAQALERGEPLSGHPDTSSTGAVAASSGSELQGQAVIPALWEVTR